LPAPILLYVAISYHGFGHIAQTAPIVNELSRRIPRLKVIVQCSAPARILRNHFTCAFEHLLEAPDIGMAMANSFDVLVDVSYKAYLSLHREWQARIEREALRLHTLKPALVLASVPYLTLAAAALAGIPAAVVCSLNWAEIFYSYCRGKPYAELIYRQIREAYSQASVFLTPKPSMPMSGLGNTCSIGPIARQGRDRRSEINERLMLDPNDKLVLIFLGGITTPLAIADWPRLPGINLLMPGTDSVERAGIYTLEEFSSMPHIDVVCSVDALITKPGYGSFTEAACNAVPVLYVKRGDWPEEPSLVRWLEEQACCLELDRECLARGRFKEFLEVLWMQAPKSRIEPTGAIEAADLLEAYLMRK
jgi:hypothetical protein